MGATTSPLISCQWCRTKYGGRCILLIIICVLTILLYNHKVVIDEEYTQWIALEEVEETPPPPGDNFCEYLLTGPVPPGSPWWKYICLFERIQDETVVAGCRDSVKVGNWPTCIDKEYLPDAQCLVYSFGIANDWSFDEAMAKKGCRVFSFDPSMNVDDHQHSQNVAFKNMGLGATDIDDFSPRKDDYVKKEQKWKIRTLKSVIKLLGHEQTFIDVLKFDVEAYEWDVMANIIKDGLLPQIGQVLTEWHIFYNLPPKSTFEKHINLFDSLKDHGLQVFFKDIYNRKHKRFEYNSQCNFCYVNTNTSRTKFYSTIKPESIDKHA